VPGFKGYDYALAHFRLKVERRFQIFRVDVHSGGRDNHVFLAPLEV
jgi:hypothetical protein